MWEAGHRITAQLQFKTQHAVEEKEGVFTHAIFVISSRKLCCIVKKEQACMLNGRCL